MDETTKTILGMLSAFLIAFMTSFLAEPMKAWFESKRKIKRLRIILYKEIYGNYGILSFPTDSKKYIRDSSKYLISTECYRYAKEKELVDLYNLEEVSAINIIYKLLELYLDTSSENEEDYVEFGKNIIDNIKYEVKHKNIKINILKKFLTKKQVKEILDSSTISTTSLIE